MVTVKRTGANLWCVENKYNGKIVNIHKNEIKGTFDIKSKVNMTLQAGIQTLQFAQSQATKLVK